MDLEHSFTVPVPKERAWTVLLDVERVAPCMPGATLDSADGDVINGKIKVKVGPISMTYAGTARFTEKNAEAGEVTLEASGKETRGAGTASATVRSVLEDRGSETRVIVYTSLNVTGKPAQFGRGVMAEVGGKLIGIFAANLAEMLTADQSDGAAEAGAEPAGTELAGTELAGTEEDPLSLPLEELRLPLRSYNSLRKEGVHTVGDLAARTPQQLLAIENIGPASVDEIRQRLAEHDLTLGEAPAGADAFASANGRSGPPASGTGTFGAAASQTAASDAVAPETAAPETAPPGTSVSGAGAGASGPQPTPQPFAPSRPGDNDAIDLLSVAGVPVLKRAVPALAALIAVALVVLGLRRRRRRRRG